MNVIELAREAIGLRGKATQGVWYATNAECGDGGGRISSDDYDGRSWTVSLKPDAPGWNTDGGYPGYGLDPDNAAFIAYAANYLALIASALIESERLCRTQAAILDQWQRDREAAISVS